jgi:tetratricopeptide (TPR) repeat protein
VSEVDQARPELAALIEQLGSGACDWTDPRIPALLAWLRAGQRRSELQALLRSTASRMQTLPAVHALPLIELAKELELIPLAFALSALAQLASDPAVAAERARLAMHMRDYTSAIAASEVAIAALLQPGMSIDEFLRRCVAGAPAEGMLRFERHVLADRTHLSERLALRWEALHRAGRSRDASLMQLMCQRYFPERASVWATAGNHALDGDDLSAAEQYFQRCLQLDPSWHAALAGLAIVHERRKDWAAALPYRRRVLEVTRALEQADAASLQRRLRYAAALARLGQWTRAEPLFRSAAHAPAVAQLPAEHPVLLRVFSQELYAPALVSALLLRDSKETSAGQEPAVTLAQHEAMLLERLGLQLAAAEMTAPDARWAQCLCAYLAGQLERAYELLDQVEVDRPDDLAVHYLLWRCASAVGHEQAPSIRVFAEQAARTLWAERERAQPSIAQLGYAVAIVPELASQVRSAGYSVPADALEELDPIDAPVLTQLERLAAFRATHQAAGHSPLVAAAASTHALAALTD